MAASFLVFTESTEQDVVDIIAKFLVRYVGWTVAQNVTDTASDRDIVLRSTGENSANNPNPRYIRLRGNINNIYLSTYETFVNISTNTGEVSDATYGLLQCNGTVIAMVVADLERVFIHIEEDTGPRFFGYVGRIDPYTEWPQHPYPNIVKGMAQTAYDFFYTASPFNMFMRRNDGTVSPYFPVLLVNSNTVVAAGHSTRNGQISGFRIPVVYKDVAAQSEIAGELRGVYWMPDAYVNHGDYIRIDDRPYVVIQGTASTAWAVGPISRDRNLPAPIPSGVDLISAL